MLFQFFQGKPGHDRLARLAQRPVELGSVGQFPKELLQKGFVPHTGYSWR
jgi:hypothetical protein